MAKTTKSERTKWIIVGLLVISVVVLLGLLVRLILSSGESGTIEVPDDVATMEVPSIAGEDASLIYFEGELQQMVPEDTPVVEVFSDFLCPYCGQFENLNGSFLQEKSERGEIALVLHPISILDRFTPKTQFSTRTASAAFEVAEHDPDKFIDFYSKLFAVQPAENDVPRNVTEWVSKQATEIGVSATVVDSFAEARFGPYVLHETQVIMSGGIVQGTPTIAINGELVPDNVNILDPEQFSSYVDQVTAE